MQVLTSFHNDFSKKINESIKPNESIRSNFISLIKVHLEHVKENPEVHFLFQGEARFLHISRQIQLTELLESVIDLITNMFEVGKKRNEVKTDINSRHIAYAYFGIFDIFMFKFEKESKLDREIATENFVETITNLLFNGILLNRN
jgi:hypothetical protein